jgi:hypothetical protein
MNSRNPRVAGTLAAILLGAVACVAAPPAARETQSPTGTSSAPAASATRTWPSQPLLSFTPLPVLSPDEFWNTLFSGDPAFTEYHSLGALIRDSDAVVVATLVSVSPGTNFDAGNGWTEYDAWVNIRVDRVLHGSLPTTPVINVVLGDSLDQGDPYGPVVSQLKASMPHEQGILFIQNLASWQRQMTGKSTADPSLYAVISAQGVFRNANGVVKKAINAPGAWPQAFAGKSFGDVVSDVASSKPEPLPSPSGG